MTMLLSDLVPSSPVLSIQLAVEPLLPDSIQPYQVRPVGPG